MKLKYLILILIIPILIIGCSSDSSGEKIQSPIMGLSFGDSKSEAKKQLERGGFEVKTKLFEDYFSVEEKFIFEDVVWNNMACYFDEDRLNEIELTSFYPMDMATAERLIETMEDAGFTQTPSKSESKIAKFSNGEVNSYITWGQLPTWVFYVNE